MLTKAYVLINTEMGYEKEVLNVVNSIPGVKKAYNVYGVYDIIVDLELDNTDLLKELIQNRIRRLDHVRSTLTLFVQP